MYYNQAFWLEPDRNSGPVPVKFGPPPVDLAMAGARPVPRFFFHAEL